MKILLTLIVSVAALGVFVLTARAQKLTAADVVAKHLAAIGTPDTRAAIKTRIAVGDASARFVSTKNLPVAGRIVMASDGDKSFFGTNFNSTLYPGERFVFDGRRTLVGSVGAQNRSILGNFIQSNSVLIESGLLGGVLTTTWALEQIASVNPKLSYDGVKNVDGRDAYTIGYSPRRGSDVSILLYFDKETFRHVRTEYKRTSSASIGARPEDSTRFSETRIKLTENFSDFKTQDGVTFPQKYQLIYSIIGQNGTTEIRWDFAFTEFAFNRPLDAKTFDVGSN